MFTSFLIALGLNFDTFSVSVVEGASLKKHSLKDSIKVGIIFGVSQAFLAAAGSFLGMGFKSLISNIDHWIAFVLLCLIGFKMIREAGDKIDCPEKQASLDIKKLFLLGVATSIDALVVGITLAFIKGQIYEDILAIGAVTFIASFLGFHMGKDFKRICKNKTKIIGGLILIAIGVKILLEHIYLK